MLIERSLKFYTYSVWKFTRMLIFAIKATGLNLEVWLLFFVVNSYFV
jgi:hypothetical protein